VLPSRASPIGIISKLSTPSKSCHARNAVPFPNPAFFASPVLREEILQTTLQVQGVSPTTTTTKAKTILTTPATATQAAKPMGFGPDRQARTPSWAASILPRRASRETEMAWSHRLAVVEAGSNPAGPRWNNACVKMAPMAARAVQPGPALALAVSAVLCRLESAVGR
jgi:hypothetical protein